MDRPSSRQADSVSKKPPITRKKGGFGEVFNGKRIVRGERKKGSTQFSTWSFQKGVKKGKNTSSSDTKRRRFINTKQTTTEAGERLTKGREVTKLRRMTPGRKKVTRNLRGGWTAPKKEKIAEDSLEKERRGTTPMNRP